MARGTARKVAGKAAAAAKRVTSGGARRSATTKAPAKKAPAKKSTPAKKAAPATKAAAKKGAPATKAAAKKASPAKKTAAKKTAAKKTAAKKTVAKKAAPATKAAATKATPAKKTATKKTVAKKTAAKKVTAPVKKATPAKKTAAKKAAPVKKAAAKKAAPARAPRKLAVKADEKPWTKKELDEVRGELLAERDRLKNELNLAEHELHDLMRDAGDGAGNDQADVGSTTFERDHEMSLANNAREMLAQTQKALTRIDDGTYGVCERCGEPIGKMRLMAFPRATLCLSCKQREERR